MIGPIVAWWLASTAAALCVFPIVWRLFDRLPDRGFGVSRALGILVGGYVFWLGVNFGFLGNHPGGAITALLLVVLVSVLTVRHRWVELGTWIRKTGRTLIVMEAAFLVAFVVWAIVRSYNPEIVATEKPMELAFLNSILRSPTFPPQDPWLSGYAISYYYLGYVLLAFLTWLTGTTAGVSFNLGNAMWFALVVVGSYAVVYNLLTLNRGLPRRLAALLGPLFVVITGNLGGALEVLHARHVFWTTLADGTMVSRFWSWLNLEDLAVPPGGPPVFPPNRFWWWWQASRVVNDIDLAGRHVEVIDEFPFFSFLLADNHPHVLALPFAIVAVALAIQVLVTPRQGGFRFQWIRLSPQTQSTALWIAGSLGILAVVGRAVSVGATAGWDSGVIAAAFRTGFAAAIVVGGLVAFGALATGRVLSGLTTMEIVLVGWLMGTLAFLNTWDLAIYPALILGAAAWGLRRQRASEAVQQILWGGAGVVIVALLAILPWQQTFESQVSLTQLLLPNLVFPTRLPQFLIMFLVVLVPSGAWLVFRTLPELRRPRALRSVIGMVVGLSLLGLLGSWAVAGFAILLAPDAIQEGIRAVGATGTAELAASALARRAASPWVPLLLGFFVALVLLFLRRDRDRDGEGDIGAFVALMIGLGALLVLFPEFAYLRDLFGTRMNTVFKFYYAAWLLWGLAAAYGLAKLWDSAGRRGLILGGLASVPLLLGLIYTVTATWEKTSGFSATAGPTLDGTAHLAVDNPQDAVAIQWMRSTLRPGIIAEAVGGSYTGFARVSAHTGFPTVLGWDFHEYQWRGSFEPQGTRKEDIERLYVTRDWEVARQVLEQYDIDYVYVGPLEKVSYPGLVTRKFEVFMDRLFSAGDVTIYGRRTDVGS